MSAVRVMDRTEEMLRAAALDEWPSVPTPAQIVARLRAWLREREAARA